MHTVVVLIAQYAIALPVVAWVAVLLRLPKNRWLTFILFSAASTLLTLVLVKVATTVHQDPRPFIRDGVHPYFSSSTDNGFPSDHTAFSALLGFIITRYHTKLGCLLLVASLLIGTARVISGVHHVQDIIGGFCIAGIGTALALGLEVLLTRRHHPIASDNNA